MVLLFTGLLLSFFSIFIFQQFLKITAEEVIESWLKAESTTLQQGNLLYAVTRTQGLALAGNFVTEIHLKKNDHGKLIDLIDFGSNQIPWQKNTGSPGKIQWIHVGLFSWSASYNFPSDENITIQFVFYSTRAVLVFFIYLGIISLLLLISSFLITQIERKNAIEREFILREAIENLIEDKSIPYILRLKVPKLIEYWQSFKDLLKQHTEQETKNQAAILVSKIAKQVAHDIRSPISVLNIVIKTISISEEKRSCILSAVQRINNIADNLLNQERLQIQSGTSTPISLEKKQTIITTIQPTVRTIITEKRVELHNRPNVQITFEEESESFLAYTEVSEDILCRMLSNTINNAIEAIDRSGEIKISVRSYENYNCIVVTDNGKGIPKDTLSKLGKEGFTFGKPNGNGLGLHFIKVSIEKVGGRLEIQSRENFGTMVTLMFPK